MKFNFGGFIVVFLQKSLAIRNKVLKNTYLKWKRNYRRDYKNNNIKENREKKIFETNSKMEFSGIKNKGNKIGNYLANRKLNPNVQY